VGYEPDFLWIKDRTSVRNHILIDQLRGDSTFLKSNETDAEATNTDVVASLDADGFTVGVAATCNFLNNSYVAWNWKASGAGTLNEQGSIDSTVSVGATSQQNWFSIVGYQGNGTAGATVGHGLNGAVPEMIIVKNRDTARVWPVYHGYNTSAPETEWLRLNDTNATADELIIWNDTEPTSSVFTLGSSVGVNESGDNFIAYCFANAENLCRVGSYTGNGSTDGTFVFTGHRPAYVMLKRTDSAAGWNIIDAERSPINPNDKRLEAQGSGAEGTNSAYNLDFLSNGFKLRTTNPEWNASGGSYIFISISEQPFKYANAR
jgi:hypothetical protein